MRNMSKRRYLTSLIDSLGLGAGARLDATGDRAVDVVVRDPALVVVLSRSDGNGGRLGAGERLSNIDGLLGLLVGTGSLSLGEESLDPCLVDEVEGTGESSREEEVEEDNLGVKEAGGSLDDGSRTVVNQDLVEVASGISDDSGELNADLLRLHVLGERERKLLLLAGRDLNVVLDGGQVAHDAGVAGAVLGKLLHGVERASDEGDIDSIGILVVDLDDSLGRTTVDELDTENISFGESSLDISLERSLGSGIGFRSVLSNSAKDLSSHEGEQRSLEEHDDEKMKENL